MSTPPVKESRAITCYSAGEGGFMRQSQALRERLLSPLLGCLFRFGINPNHLTVFSLLAGLAFSPVFLGGSKPLAFALMLVHVLLDGLDGPLARYQQKASSRGSFTDTMSDQIVITVSTLTLVHGGFAGVWPGGLYVFFYSMVVIFAMVRNALAIPYSWLVRPRLVIYAWLPVEVYLWPGSLNWLLWISSLLLAVKMLTGFIQIRRQI